MKLHISSLSSSGISELDQSCIMHLCPRRLEAEVLSLMDLYDIRDRDNLGRNADSVDRGNQNFWLEM